MKQNSLLFIQRSEQSGRGRVWYEGLLSALLFVSLGGTLAALTGMFALTEPWTALAAGLLVCAVHVALRLLGWERWFLPGVLLPALLVTVIWLPYVSGGLYLVWNRACQVWTEATGRLFLGVQTAERASVPLLSAIAAVLTAVLSTLAVGRSRGIAAVLLAVGLAAVCLLLAAVQTGLWPVLLALCAVLLALSGGAAPVRAGILGAGFCAAGVLLMAAALWMFGVPDSLPEAAERAWHRLRYEQTGTHLPEGDFSQALPEPDSETALLVAMEQPEAMYLRGFVGDTFRNGRWEPAENARWAEQADLLYWLHREGFYPQNQLSEAAALLEDTEINRVTVQNVGACSQYAYVPYSLQATGFLEPAGLQGSHVAADGQRSYTYTAIANADEQLAELLTLLQEQADSAYLRQEGSFRVLVHDLDRTVPTSALGQLQAALDECCSEYGGVGRLTAEQAQRSALKFLESYLPGGEKAGTIRLPLEETAAGTTYQYATAVALALRYYGFPARYAEGYVITEDMAEQAQPGQQIAVDGSCAGAWAEVYQDGLGWLPIDVTPGFEALSGQQTEDGIRPAGLLGTDSDAQLGSTPGDGDGYYLAEGEELDDDQSAELEDDQDHLDSGGQRIRLEQAVRWTLWLLLLLALLLPAAAILRRRLLLNRQKKQFENQDCSEAIGAIFANTALLLEGMGLKRGGGSLFALSQAADQLEPGFAEALTAAAALNGEALFSSHDMTDQQRQQAAEFRQRALGLLKKQGSLWTRLRLKWIICAY